jgi:hypothetical protein
LLHVAYNTSIIRALNNVIYGKLRLFDLWKLHNLHQKTKSTRNLKHQKNNKAKFLASCNLDFVVTYVLMFKFQMYNICKDEALYIWTICEGRKKDSLVMCYHDNMFTIGFNLKFHQKL